MSKIRSKNGDIQKVPEKAHNRRGAADNNNFCGELWDSWDPGEQRLGNLSGGRFYGVDDGLRVHHKVRRSGRQRNSDGKRLELACGHDDKVYLSNSLCGKEIWYCKGCREIFKL